MRFSFKRILFLGFLLSGFCKALPTTTSREATSSSSSSSSSREATSSSSSSSSSSAVGAPAGGSSEDHAGTPERTTRSTRIAVAAAKTK